ncbi:MAG TPA: hypothetical protein VG100_09955 [Xanthobacteraceae bacterium]|nr:hypothetical protein [Xanthobacteraceae bacterium]
MAKRPTSDLSGETERAREKLELRAEELEVRVKELDVQAKEFDAKYRSSLWRTWMVNPVIISALIAGWAGFTAAGITWLSGQISASTQRDLENRKFEADLILNALKSDSAAQAALNIRVLVDLGLIRNEELLRRAKNDHPA